MTQEEILQKRREKYWADKGKPVPSIGEIPPPCSHCGFSAKTIGAASIHSGKCRKAHPERVRQMTNRFEIRGQDAIIFLVTRNGVKEAIIDAEDLPIISTIDGNWRAAYDKRHDTWYASHGTPKPFRTTLSMHRVLTSAPAGAEVDHIDHDGLNNRRSSNLRVVTTSINQLNRKGASSRSKTGILNVDFNKASGKYRAIVRVSKKAHFLGSFESKDEAAEAVRSFRKERGIECPL